jgi:C1A family cysteine protease
MFNLNLALLIFVIVFVFVIINYFYVNKNTNQTINTTSLLPLKSIENPISINRDSNELPRYFKYMEKVITGIRAQGRCASCWGFAVNDILSDRISIYTGGKIKKILSVQELVSCYKPLEFICSTGGLPEEAYNYLIQFGVLEEKDYPYEQLSSKKILECKIPNSGPRDLTSDFLPIVLYRDVINRTYAMPGTIKHLCVKSENKETIEQNIKNMKQEIFFNGPIVGTLMIYDDFHKYDGKSVYKRSPAGSKFIGGHAIVIFGWSEENENTKEKGFGGRYWICKNSWGSKWPHKDFPGWFYVRMGVNECGIESRASSVKPYITEEMKLFNNKIKREDVSYTSYNKYFEDPEKINFFNYVKN